ncbi:MAG: aldo/keto reductase [Rhodobacteraceae bacterium]|nr:aldo/keto reductase [Paracoccaceae bacterium]
MSLPETRKLSQTHEISRVIKGCWQLAGDHGSVDREQAIGDMEAFLDAGITTFDCADIYTGVEVMIGEFIADVRRRRGAATAQQICVHTKLVPDLSRLSNIRPEEIIATIDRSLQRLQVERLDLVQFFWWDLTIGDSVEALGILKDLKANGKIGNIGVTNWDAGDIDPFVRDGFDVVSAQVQYSILDRRPSHGLAKWSSANNVQLLCYGTLAGGFLTEKWLGKPDPGFEFENRSLIKYRLIIDEFGSWDLFQSLLVRLKEIGDRHGVSLSTIATRYVLDQPQVAAAIVGARYARHLPKTLDVFGVAFDDQDHRDLNEVIQHAKGPSGDVYALEKDRTGRHGRIMKYNLNSKPGDQTYEAAIANG